MNDFMDDLADDLNDNFFNSDEFGEDEETIIYRPASGAPEKFIQGLFDSASSDAVTEATEDVNEHTPHLTCREIDIEGGELQSKDRFVIRNIEYKPVSNGGSNKQGVIRTFLHEV